MEKSGPSYRALEDIYNKYFSLGYINKDINTRFALISLICWIYNHLKEKNPDVTYYQIVYKLSKGLGLEDDFIKGLSIVCENFGYGCEKFPTFDIKPKDIAKTIRDILSSYMPF